MESSFLFQSRRGDPLFARKDGNSQQYSIFQGPFGVTLLLSLSNVYSHSTQDALLALGFRKIINDIPQELIELESLQLRPSTTSSQEIVWVPTANQSSHNVDEIVSLIAERFAKHISDEFENRAKRQA